MTELCLQLVVIRTLVTGLRLVAPSSIAYTLVSGLAGHFLYSAWLGWYALAESAFHLFLYLPRKRLLQKPTVYPPPPLLEERQALFAKCLPYICKAKGSSVGWFYSLNSPGSLISRENAVDLLLLLLFNAKRKELCPEWKGEIEGYIAKIEQTLGHKFECGRSDKHKGMLFTLDPVFMLHRPLLWYFIVATIDTCMSLILRWKGFHHFEVHSWMPCFPPRLSAAFSQPSPHADMGYWIRPHRDPSKYPILFFHGVGMGLTPYVPFLADIAAADPDVGIIAIENLSISMRITTPILKREAMLAAITRILDYHGFSEVVVAGHSYGTVITTHMLRDPVLSKRIAAVLLIDPIAPLAYMPDLTYNFVYRQPRRASEWLLWYFTCRDPDTSRAIARNFLLTENTLWKDDLVEKEVAIVLAGRDLLLDTKEIRRYFTGEDEERFRWQHDGMEVLYHADIGHEEVFFSDVRRRSMVEILAKFVRMRKVPGMETMFEINRRYLLS